MLSAAKHLGLASEMLRCAQHDKTWPILKRKTIRGNRSRRAWPPRDAKRLYIHKGNLYGVVSS